MTIVSPIHFPTLSAGTQHAVLDAALTRAHAIIPALPLDTRAWLYDALSQYPDADLTIRYINTVNVIGWAMDAAKGKVTS